MENTKQGRQTFLRLSRTVAYILQSYKNMLTAKRRALLFSAASVRNAYALASRQAVVGQIEVHSCINIYNFRQQIRDRFVSWKSHLRTTIRRVEETVGFVVFPKCFVVFPKCCLRGLSGACRVAVRYEKTPEQARDNRRSAPMLTQR